MSLGADAAEMGGLLRSLAASVEFKDPDFDDEHDRWAIYKHALESGTSRAQLQRAVTLETDLQVALSLVQAAMDVEPPETWSAWVAALSDSANRASAATRLAEHTVLSTLTAPIDAALVDTWSDWLQRRLASAPTSAEVHTALQLHGRTKRVRSEAAESERRRAILRDT